MDEDESREAGRPCVHHLTHYPMDSHVQNAKMRKQEPTITQRKQTLSAAPQGLCVRYHPFCVLD